MQQLQQSSGTCYKSVIAAHTTIRIPHETRSSDCTSCCVCTLLTLALHSHPTHYTSLHIHTPHTTHTLALHSHPTHYTSLHTHTPHTLALHSHHTHYTSLHIHTPHTTHTLALHSHPTHYTSHATCLDERRHSSLAAARTRESLSSSRRSQAQQLTGCGANSRQSLVRRLNLPREHRGARELARCLCRRVEAVVADPRTRD
jgi:hypothetical protein